MWLIATGYRTPAPNPVFDMLAGVRDGRKPISDPRENAAAVAPIEKAYDTSRPYRRLVCA